MRVLHVIPNFHLGEPQLAVLEFARVARLRGIRAKVLALSDEGEAVRQMLERQLITTQSLASTANGALKMQLLQNNFDVIQTHSLADFSTVLPAVVDMNARLFHAFHTCASGRRAELPAGNGYIDSVGWSRATHQTDDEGMADLGDIPMVPDGVWSPPCDTLNRDEQRRALGIGSDTFAVGLAFGGGHQADIETMRLARAALAEDGVDAQIVLFGGDGGHELPKGFKQVSCEDAAFLQRLAGLDAFAQLRGNDFCQLSLLALARRVPVVLPGPAVAAGFRGGWSPFRFAEGDVNGLVRQLLNYARHPGMHEAHRSLVRDYVLTFRDSMSMVGSYARLYRRRVAEAASW